MSIDYKKELEATAKTMILVHDPNTLIKMIVRMIVRKVKVSHAGILLHYKDTDSYVLTDSQGPSGLKIPAGFARMDKDNPLIRLFCTPAHREALNAQFFVYERAKSLLKKRIDAGFKKVLTGALYELEIFEALVCIPSYFRNDLLGILLLGKKRCGRKFAQSELNFFMALTYDVAMAIRNAQLFKDLERELEQKQRLFIHTSIALAAAIDAKDHYTHGHTMRVTAFSLEIAKRLAQKNKNLFDAKFFEDLRIAGALHDIGKIGIPELILNKAGPLDETELKKMKEHTLVGSVILQPIKELSRVILGVKYHHERYDGSGYPEGLKGEDIPLIASIIAVADTFDAMTTDRPYRKALQRQQAIEEIKKISGKQFNPDIVSAFLEIHNEKFPQGNFSQIPLPASCA